MLLVFEFIYSNEKNSLLWSRSESSMSWKAHASFKVLWAPVTMSAEGLAALELALVLALGGKILPMSTRHPLDQPS